MSDLLATYMSCQAAQMQKVLENLYEEERAILTNDRFRMQQVLHERRVLLDGLQQIGDCISDQLDKQEVYPIVDGLNSEIKTLAKKVDQHNKKNKMLLHMRTVKTRVV